MRMIGGIHWTRDPLNDAETRFPKTIKVTFPDRRCACGERSELFAPAVVVPEIVLYVRGHRDARLVWLPDRAMPREEFLDEYGCLLKNYGWMSEKETEHADKIRKEMEDGLREAGRKALEEQSRADRFRAAFGGCLCMETGKDDPEHPKTKTGSATVKTHGTETGKRGKQDAKTSSEHVFKMLEEQVAAREAEAEELVKAGKDPDYVQGFISGLRFAMQTMGRATEGHTEGMHGAGGTAK